MYFMPLYTSNCQTSDLQLLYNLAFWDNKDQFDTQVIFLPFNKIQVKSREIPG